MSKRLELHFDWICAVTAAAVGAYWVAMFALGSTLQSPGCDLLCEFGSVERGQRVANYYFASTPLLAALVFAAVLLCLADSKIKARAFFATAVLVGAAAGAGAAAARNLLQSMLIGELGELDWEISHLFGLSSVGAGAIVFAIAGAVVGAIYAMTSAREA